MATITKVNNNIIVQADNSSQPAVFSNWTNAQVRATDDRIVLTINGKGFIFTDNYAISPCGPLLFVNGIDIVDLSYDNYQVADLIRGNVLTEDQFSANPTIIDDTAQHTGPFTAVQIDEDAVFNVTPGSGTIIQNGAGTAIDISGWSGVTFKAGTTKYGNFAELRLVSGKVTAYSNQ